MKVSSALRIAVAGRAGHRCEYCLRPETQFRHHIDHVIAQKHGGPTTEENLAYACAFCNLHKGSDLFSVAGIRLFNPRTQQWKDHFAVRGCVIEPLTPEGEATVQMLQMNRDERVRERAALQAAGKYPAD